MFIEDLKRRFLTEMYWKVLLKLLNITIAILFKCGVVVAIAMLLMKFFYCSCFFIVLLTTLFISLVSL